MAAVRTGALLLLCAIDLALGVWLAWVFGVAAFGQGLARTATTENAGHIMSMVAALAAPVLVWRLRGRASYRARLLLAGLPIGLFFLLGGRFWVRFG